MIPMIPTVCRYQVGSGIWAKVFIRVIHLPSFPHVGMTLLLGPEKSEFTVQTVFYDCYGKEMIIEFEHDEVPYMVEDAEKMAMKFAKENKSWNIV
jgi:hypothetical protein